jgi:drug/metabolite transporter (DMT)-like permease
MLSSGFVLTLPLILLFENPIIVSPTFVAWFLWLTLGIMGTAIAYLFYYWLIEHAGATYASLVTFMLPPMGVFWGALVLGETISWHAALGLIVIGASILVVNGYLDRPWARLVAGNLFG